MTQIFCEYGNTGGIPTDRLTILGNILGVQ